MSSLALLPASFFFSLGRISDFDLFVGLNLAFLFHPRFTFTTRWCLLIVFASAQTSLFQPLPLLPIAARELGLVRLQFFLWVFLGDVSKSALANSRLYLALFFLILSALKLRSITALQVFIVVVLNTTTCRHDIMFRRGRV